MHPIGLSGHRKLQDIFSDAKVTKNNRQNIPVFVCNNKIAWIPGYRIAQCRAVDNAQQKSLEIKVTRITDEI
jgi:tRNA(Ile)-lysidine synthase